MTGSASVIKGLYCIVDTAYVSPEDLVPVALRIIEGKARVLQLRAKGLGGKELLKAARELRKITLEHGVVFMINDRVDIAMLASADGVHLGQDDIPVEDARKMLGAGSIIGLSTHNRMEAALAASLGADYISFGPVYHTETKKDAQKPKGLSGLKEARFATTLPIVAIGGVTEANMGEVFASGASSIAMISEILLSGEVSKKTEAIVSGIKKLRF